MTKQRIMSPLRSFSTLESNVLAPTYSYALPAPRSARARSGVLGATIGAQQKNLLGCLFLESKVLAPTYSYALYWVLPSALAGLTAEFGMGSGVAPPLEAPGHWTQGDMKKRL